MTTKINAELVKILSKDKNLRPEAEQVLERLSISKDAIPTARQKESLLFCCKLLDSAVAIDEAIQQTLENAKEKPDAEYVPNAIAQQKTINEAQLKEIAARYVMRDRIPEISSALKLKPESMTNEQFEQFREACEQVQQGIDLEIVAQGVLNKASAKPSVPGGKTHPEKGGAALTQRKEDRPLPSFATGTAITAVAEVDLTGIPVDDGVATTWDEVAKVGAASDADALAGAPFDGIIEGSDYVNEKAEALKQHGFNLYMEKFDDAMHDPELAKRVEDKYLGKFPARWNLKPKS
jgi:hypothetical protein